MNLYKYLVVAALQEELTAFTNLIEVTPTQVDLDVECFSIEGQTNFEILTFTINKMGMSANAASIMKIISKFNPKFTFFIGTCAGLREHEIGSVLVPFRVFSYESGKYENRIFYPDYLSYETSETLRKKAQILWDSIKATSKDKAPIYKVVTDEDFCSGSAVINDANKVKEIRENGARKLSGLEMEAYSIAYINHVLKPDNELLVIKGISDYADNKAKSEKENGKELAMDNCADFTLKLIEYLEEKNIVNDYFDKYFQIYFESSFEASAYYKLKVKINIRNNFSFPIVIESESFNPKLKIDPIANNTKHRKPVFLVCKGLKPEAEIKEIVKAGNFGVNGLTKDIYEATCVIKPYEFVLSCWLPIDPKVTKEALATALSNKEVGTWKLKCHVLGSEVYSKRYTINL